VKIASGLPFASLMSPGVTSTMCCPQRYVPGSIGEPRSPQRTLICFMFSGKRLLSNRCLRGGDPPAEAQANLFELVAVGEPENGLAGATVNGNPRARVCRVVDDFDGTHEARRYVRHERLHNRLDVFARLIVRPGEGPETDEDDGGDQEQRKHGVRGWRRS
jgi:hypothetical protein